MADDINRPLPSPSTHGTIEAIVADVKRAEAPSRWYQVLSLPEIAMLLIARTMGNEFRLPTESVPDWYGISADSASRGLHGLEAHGLLSIEKYFKEAPLTPQGYTAENRYTLQPPFGPMPVRQSPKRKDRR